MALLSFIGALLFKIQGKNTPPSKYRELNSEIKNLWLIIVEINDSTYMGSF